jgi:hypothetical protein
MNLYAYVKNNPLRFLDPMGTSVRSSGVESPNSFDNLWDSAVSGSTIYGAGGDVPTSGKGTNTIVGIKDDESIGEKVTNLVVKVYYESKGAYEDLTSTPIGRISVSGFTGAVGGGQAGYDLCGIRCITPGVIFGISGGLIKGTIKEATDYYDIRDKIIFGDQQ